MAVKPLKIKIKEPTPSAADRMNARHQAIRKEKGLPDPSEYKKKLDAMKKEEVEQLDEISDKLKASYVSKAKDQIKQTQPWTKKGEYKDLAKNLIAKRQKGIAKVSEEAELDEQLYKKERFVSGPPKKDFKAHTLVSPKNEDTNMMTVQNKSGGRMKVSKIFKDIYKKHGYAPVPGTRNIGEEVIKESDDVKADQISTDNQKFPPKAKMSWDDMMSKDSPVKKSRKASIVRSAAKKSNPEDAFVANPVLDSDVNPQTNKQ